MRLFFITITLLLFTIKPSAQDLKTVKVLTPLQEEADTFSVQVNYSKNGTIKTLKQSYLEYDSINSFAIVEAYKKDKSWTVWRFKEMVKKRKKRKTILQEVLDGEQLQFNEQGQITYIDYFKEGIADEISLMVAYYKEGKIKFVAEIKDEQIWNIREYKYPNGADYKFGDFKDGEGLVVHLNDKGEPCLECNTKNNITVGKVICENEE